MELQIGSFLVYSSSSRSFFPFLITSTGGGDGGGGGDDIEAGDIFLIAFFDFFGSLCLKSRRPIAIPLVSCFYLSLAKRV